MPKRPSKKSVDFDKIVKIDEAWVKKLMAHLQKELKSICNIDLKKELENHSRIQLEFFETGDLKLVKLNNKIVPLPKTQNSIRRVRMTLTVTSTIILVGLLLFVGYILGRETVKFVVTIMDRDTQERKEVEGTIETNEESNPEPSPSPNPPPPGSGSAG